MFAINFVVSRGFPQISRQPGAHVLHLDITLKNDEKAGYVHYGR